jgi:hypothetical protein
MRIVGVAGRDGLREQAWVGVPGRVEKQDPLRGDCSAGDRQRVGDSEEQRLMEAGGVMKPPRTPWRSVAT